jgi:hypothetical protein
MNPRGEHVRERRARTFPKGTRQKLRILLKSHGLERFRTDIIRSHGGVSGAFFEVRHDLELPAGMPVSFDGMTIRYSKVTP